MMQKIKLCLLAAGILITAAACGRKGVNLPPKEYENGQEEPDQNTGARVQQEIVEKESFPGMGVLSEAPSMELLYRLENQIPASTESLGEILPGSYNWHYYDKKGNMRLTLRGTNLLSRSEQADKISAAALFLSWPVMPDGIAVSGYSLEAVFNGEQEPEFQKTCEDTYLVELEPDKIYVITAEWKRERLEESGFYGDASYVIVTE
ncbi:hypothetical protein AALB64_12135 [Lachnospiraceae bacterium 45-P1]